MILKLKTLKNIIKLAEDKTQNELSELELQFFEKSQYCKARVLISFKADGCLFTVESEAENEEA